jgi:hypothetical protein
MGGGSRRTVSRASRLTRLEGSVTVDCDDPGELVLEGSADCDDSRELVRAGVLSRVLSSFRRLSRAWKVVVVDC